MVTPFRVSFSLIAKIIYKSIWRYKHVKCSRKYFVILFKIQLSTALILRPVFVLCALAVGFVKVRKLSGRNRIL